MFQRKKGRAVRDSFEVTGARLESRLQPVLGRRPAEAGTPTPPSRNGLSDPPFNSFSSFCAFLCFLWLFLFRERILMRGGGSEGRPREGSVVMRKRRRGFTLVELLVVIS